MAALEYDLTINQGETWSISFPVMDGTGAPLAVAGWTARAQIRLYKHSVTPVFEWNTTRGNALCAGTSVTLNLTPTDTATWAFDKALYDIELTDPQGGVTRLAEGRVLLNAEITR